MGGPEQQRDDELQVAPASGYYPVALDLRGRACLVVGGGAVAQRKAGGLLAAGALVTVVAPEARPMPGGVTVRLRPFADADLADVALAVAASDDHELNARVARLARERGVWVNVVDDPHAGDVILPAVARSGGLQIAVSTGGASPALAQRLRVRLEDEFGPEYGELVALLGELRAAWEPRGARPGTRCSSCHWGSCSPRGVSPRPRRRREPCSSGRSPARPADRGRASVPMHTPPAVMPSPPARAARP